MSSKTLVVLYKQAGSCREQYYYVSSSVNEQSTVNYCMLTLVTAHLHWLRYVKLSYRILIEVYNIKT